MRLPRISFSKTSGEVDLNTLPPGVYSVMSDFVVAPMSSNAFANAGVVRSFQSFAYLVRFSSSPCTVLTFEDMMLNMLVWFLLYTNTMLATAMLARIRNDDVKSMVLMRVLK